MVSIHLTRTITTKKYTIKTYNKTIQKHQGMINRQELDWGKILIKKVGFKTGLKISNR